MKKTKRVSNADSLQNPTFDGDLTPNTDLWSLGSATKRIKTVYAGALSVAATVTSFATLNLIAVANQLILEEPEQPQQ
jgi:hypothetical protein